MRTATRMHERASPIRGTSVGSVAKVDRVKRIVPIVLFLATVALTGCTAPHPEPIATPAAATASPASTPAVAGGLPTSCDALYSPALRKFVSPDDSLALNPDWKSGPGTVRSTERGYGSYDATVAGVLSTDPGLICDWAPPVGPSNLFLTTQVRHVDEATQAAVLARMKKIDAACTPYLDGDWCVMNTPDGNGALVGESQFFRNGVWLASDWYDAGPESYTAEMVKSLFGAPGY
jgi:hypothetical protein